MKFSLLESIRPGTVRLTSMSAVKVIGGVAATAIAALASLIVPPSAHAKTFGVELTGTYKVSSDGEFAKTNDVFMDQQSVVETWTANTSCISPIECTGQVTSDGGWTGSARLDNFWYIEHDIPNWLPCSDGTFAPGHQMFILWGIDPATAEGITENIKYFAGRNVTKTSSGACGINKPVVIEMPVVVEKLS